MAIVDIYLRTPTQHGKLTTLDQKRVRDNSGTLDRLLGSLPDSPKHTVTLQGAAPAALTFLLDRIRTKPKSQTLHIKVHDQPFAKAVAIYEAAEVLDIKPRQPHIAGFIVGYLSHNKVTPDDMLVVHKCFYDRRGTCKAWRVMVHQVAWWLATSKYTAEEAIELKTAATPYPELVDAVDRQIDELFPKKRELAERLAAAEAEEEAYKAKEKEESQEA
ncbi:hypothetical protein D0864_00043 [Hortaea werneckii]|uniref:Uncharacterized protein n=1 Tax=Hortaea werneckii TaxID=91943 RepID=A0A3M7HN97_HORWE|nr:hypothetical protein KC352_g7484 [Hortaea werneckii]KAI7349821.1 hypothetical protein KC320_g5868 [Hortaea werneckii]KAI7676932.1 hypothetical protein KC319_g4195 [Hortaea werneckii]KAI7724130.1 hypothetical protein KC322_g296 [Hortaea werneckii]RMZ14920.1 hypothetical protein D0864_00043 [Hortaea werneckii]